MDAKSYYAAKRDLASIMEKVCDDHNPTIITHKNTGAAVVIMSLEDFNALTIKAMHDADKRKIHKAKNVDDLFKDLE